MNFLPISLRKLGQLEENFHDIYSPTCIYAFTPSLLLLRINYICFPLLRPTIPLTSVSDPVCACPLKYSAAAVFPFSTAFINFPLCCHYLISIYAVISSIFKRERLLLPATTPFLSCPFSVIS